LKLTAMKPVEYHVPVKWYNKEGRWEDLGLMQLFFTYLSIENNGKANAKDCSVLFVTPEGHGEFVFAQELPLLYTSIVGHGFEIKAGMGIPYEILIDGKLIPMVSKQTIAQKGGKSTVLLLFAVKGLKQSIVTLSRDAERSMATAGLPIEPRIIKLRTSTDGVLHKIKLEPSPNGSYIAEVLI